MHITVCEMPLQHVEDRLEELVSVYEAMFGMSPGSDAGFKDTLTTHSRREGFRLCAATKGSDIVGFGYGYTGLPGQFWRDSLAAAMGAEAAARWLTGYFEFVEFGVVPAARQFGVGTRIHNTLLAGLPHERAVLTVMTTNTLAHHFYEQRGWKDLYHDFRPPSGHGSYVVMGRVLS